jgi:hypothetical protein
MVPKGNTNVDLVNYLTGWIRLSPVVADFNLPLPNRALATEG